MVFVFLLLCGLVAWVAVSGRGGRGSGLVHDMGGIYKIKAESLSTMPHRGFKCYSAIFQISVDIFYRCRPLQTLFDTKQCRLLKLQKSYDILLMATYSQTQENYERERVEWQEIAI